MNVKHSSAAQIKLRSQHDIGGLDFGAVPTQDHERAAWEKRVDAMGQVLRRLPTPPISLDEMRRNAEALGDTYHRLQYGERTCHALMQVLIQRGVFTIAELGERMAELAEQDERGERR